MKHREDCQNEARHSRTEKHRHEPQINDHDQLVWGGGSYVNFYDGSTIIKIAECNTYMSPQLNNNGYVVWFDYDGSDTDVFLYDGSNTIQLTDNDYDDFYPKINDNDWVVWQGYTESIVPSGEIFLYDSLTAKDEVHERAAEYFQKMPTIEKVIKLEDLAPVLELYHHLVNAGKYDKASDLFHNRLEYPTYFQLAVYNLRIQLLKELFVDGEEKPPRLKSEADQAWTLNSLANSYALSGEPAKAVPLLPRSIGIYESQNRSL